jgi:hypothetical protein
LRALVEATMSEPGLDALRLIADPFAALLALTLATLIRGRLHAALVVVNLCLFMELVATLLDPGYRFGTLITPRLAASTLQVAAGFLLLWSWRQRRREDDSLTAR